MEGNIPFISPHPKLEKHGSSPNFFLKKFKKISLKEWGFV